MANAQELDTLPAPHTTVEAEAIPPLREGDCLTRDEFERRYEAMPGLWKAELIEGVVSVPFPVIFMQHGDPHYRLAVWPGTYTTGTPGVAGGINTSLRLDMRNEPQPDLSLLILPSHGGQVAIDAKGYLVGGPEMVQEVSASTLKRDLGKKHEAYRRNRIREYIVWRVHDGVIDWYILRGERYELLGLSSEGYYKSEVFPGLWLDPAALIAGDMALVAEVARLGLATPEHADFVLRLQQYAARQPP
jgi:hypothetical protein